MARRPPRPGAGLTPVRRSGARPVGLGRALLLAVAAWLALLPPVPGTHALMTAQSVNAANRVALAALTPPTGLTGAASGSDVRLSWTAGQNGSGYAVQSVANGTSADCAAASPTGLGTTTGTTYADAGRFSPQGTFVCYRVVTTYGAAWTSAQSNPVAAVQLGVVARAVQLVNNGDSAGCSGTGAGTFGQAGKLDCGDQIVVAFNQPIDPATIPSGSTTVCAHTLTGLVLLGSTGTIGSCLSTETVHLGTLSGGAVSGCDCRFAAGYALSDDNTTLTVTVGAKTAGDTALLPAWPALAAATWTLTPTTDATKLRSSTGAFHVCDTNTGGGNCLPATAASSTI